MSIDGVDGAGKTVFADHLAEVLRATGQAAIRISADDFHHPRAVRHRRGRDSPEGFWLGSNDYSALRQRVLDPLAPAGSRRYQTASHDLVTDQALDPPVLTAAPGAVLVMDGLFLHRDELAGVWDLSVFLQVPFAVSVARLAARDGSHPDPGPSQRRTLRQRPAAVLRGGPAEATRSRRPGRRRPRRTSARRWPVADPVRDTGTAGSETPPRRRGGFGYRSPCGARSAGCG